MRIARTRVRLQRRTDVSKVFEQNVYAYLNAEICWRTVEKRSARVAILRFYLPVTQVSSRAFIACHGYRDASTFWTNEGLAKIVGFTSNRILSELVFNTTQVQQHFDNWSRSVDKVNSLNFIH